MEIACDESGYEGESLVGGVTDVFAHAGVSLSSTAAAECVEELRRRIRSPALEYKANHLLREKNRAALEWFLGPDGPLHGHAHVYVVDKTLLLIGTILELFVGDAPGDAVALRRHVRAAAEPERWTAFLVAANDLLRSRTGHPTSVDAVLRALDTVGAGAPPVLARLRDAGPRIRAAHRAGHVVPALDPLPPAIVRAVAVWSDGGRLPVAVVHDRQTSLTAARLRGFMAATGAPAGLRFVDSRTDPRVQVADFLAGVARRAWSDGLARRADSGLLALLTPHADPASIWDGPPGPHAAPTEKHGSMGRLPVRHGHPAPQAKAP